MSEDDNDCPLCGGPEHSTETVGGYSYATCPAVPAGFGHMGLDALRDAVRAVMLAEVRRLLGDPHCRVSWHVANERERRWLMRALHDYERERVDIFVSTAPRPAPGPKPEE